MYPKGKLKVMAQIRAMIRKSDYLNKDMTERESIAKQFITSFAKKYDTTPELTAFLIQKFNAFHLNAVLVDSGTESIPFLEYLGVEKIAAELGHKNIYATLAHNLVRRSGDEKYSSYRVGINGRGSVKTASSVHAGDTIHTMLKSASRSKTLLEAAVSDPNIKYRVKALVDATEMAFGKVSSLYYGTSGLADALDKDIALKLDKNAQAVIDVLKFNADRRAGMRKTATATVYAITEFKEALQKYAEQKEKLDDVEKLAPEAVAELNRSDKKKIVPGVKITNVKAIRGGFGAIPSGSILDVNEVAGDTVYMSISRDTAEPGDDTEVEYQVPLTKIEKAGYIKA